MFQQLSVVFAATSLWIIQWASSAGQGATEEPRSSPVTPRGKGSSRESMRGSRIAHKSPQGRSGALRLEAGGQVPPTGGLSIAGPAIDVG